LPVCQSAPTQAESAAAFVPILVGGGGALITFARRRRRVKFFGCGGVRRQAP